MPDHFFPFLKLGLQCNPFGAVTDTQWADLAILSALVSARLAVQPDAHLQFVGSKGSGKTSHLRVLAVHLAATGARTAYEHLPVGQHRFTTRLAGLDYFLLDEAQRLHPLARWRLFRAAAQGLRLVLATHTDLTASFDRRNLPVNTFHVDQLTTRTHLAAIIARRLHYFALGPVPAVTLAPDAIDLLWTTYGANLRAAENALYTVFQALAQRPTPPAMLTAADLRTFSLSDQPQIADSR